MPVLILSRLFCSLQLTLRSASFPTDSLVPRNAMLETASAAFATGGYDIESCAHTCVHGRRMVEGDVQAVVIWQE